MPTGVSRRRRPTRHNQRRNDQRLPKRIWQPKHVDSSSSSSSSSSSRLSVEPKLSEKLLKSIDWFVPDVILDLELLSLTHATVVQTEALPAIMSGYDVVVRATSGSGKTYAYLICLLQTAYMRHWKWPKIAPAVIIVLPTLDSCDHVATNLKSLFESCFVKLTVGQFTSTGVPPDILVSTPGSILSCLQNTPQTEMLIFDEVDQLLRNGEENNLKLLLARVPHSCQCLVMSDNPSADVKELKRLVIHNPYIVTLSPEGVVTGGIVPYNFEQFYVSCDAIDRVRYLIGLFLDCGESDRILIFTNSNSTSYKLKLVIEEICTAWWIRDWLLNGVVVYGEHGNCQNILEKFNGNAIDVLIVADDDSQPAAMSVTEVVRGIDTCERVVVINFDMPRTIDDFFSRIDHEGMRRKTGWCVSMACSPEEMEMIDGIKEVLGDDGSGGYAQFIVRMAPLEKPDDLSYEEPVFSVIEDAMRKAAEVSLVDGRKFVAD